MQRIRVQLCGKNRYKVIILFMHKRKRGKWDFIGMIKRGGLLALLTRFDNEVFNEGGWPPFRLHVYRANKAIKGKYNAMLKHMIMLIVMMCSSFNLSHFN